MERLQDKAIQIDKQTTFKRETVDLGEKYKSYVREYEMVQTQIK